VEVNGGKRILMTVKTGSRQNKPLSSILFLIVMETLNQILATTFMELMYKAEDRVMVEPMLPDDKLTPLAVNDAAQLRPTLALYNEYAVSSTSTLSRRLPSVSIIPIHVCIPTTLSGDENS
jgi:hypothetical protein